MPTRANPPCVTTLESTSERLEGALRRLAVEAADLFDGLLASGAEIPFDLEPTPGEGPLPMYQYSPLTGEFINRHIAELRRKLIAKGLGATEVDEVLDRLRDQKILDDADFARQFARNKVTGAGASRRRIVPMRTRSWSRQWRSSPNIFSPSNGSTSEPRIS